MRYIAYCRKSTDEPDRQILSIEAQIAEIKEFAEKENLEIVTTITESKTAKKPGREKFAELIRMLEAGEANGILSWHPDRLARNSIDGGRIIYLLDTGKLLDLKFPSFWFDNTPQGKFMLNIAFGQSKYYVDNLSENVKRGNRQKLRRGEWPNHAPFGYINDSGTKSIHVDRRHAPYLAKAFEMFATGGYTYVDIINFFTKNKIFNTTFGGRIFHKDKMKRILGDPFYYGVMRFNGELYEGKHKPLITKKLFDSVQEIIKARNRKNKSLKSEFEFLGLIKCKECGCSITAEKHHRFYPRTNNSVDFIYYRCSKKKGVCNQKYARKDDIEIQLKEIVGKASMSEYAAEKFRQWANEDAQKEKLKSKGIIEKLKTELKETEDKLDRLLEGYLDKVIDSKEYQNKKNYLIEEKLSLQQRIKEISDKGSEWLEPLKNFIGSALSCAKIARAKNTCSELSIGAKTVGSNFFLFNQQLQVEYRNRGYFLLAAPPSAANPATLQPASPTLLPD
ncbi:recombinase family protein [Candidatus Daviesbacteria bacterium]|nr:recombinase family protein [Candidatus Daviesbacteria bacterium]